MTITNIKNKIKSVLRRNHVKRAGVFGSYARGQEKKKSDIDILIEYQNNDDKSLLDFIRLKMMLEKMLNKKVDLVEYDSLRKEIKNKILREQIRIL